MCLHANLPKRNSSETRYSNVGGPPDFHLGAIPEASFFTVVLRLLPLSVHTLLVCGFLKVFFLLRDGEISPMKLLLGSTLAPVLEGLATLTSHSVGSSLCGVARWEACYLLVVLASPVVRQLPQSIATDTLWVISLLCLLVYGVLGFCQGHLIPWEVFSEEETSSIPETNNTTPLVVVSCILLCSQLELTKSAALLVFGNALFFNSSRAVGLMSAAFPKQALGAYLAALSLLMSHLQPSDRSRLLQILWYLQVVCPILYYRMLRYRLIVGGPWDIWMQLDGHLCHDTVTLQVRNRYRFTDLSDFSFSYEVTSDDESQTLPTGSVGAFSCPPENTCPMSITITPAITEVERAEYFIRVWAQSKTATPLRASDVAILAANYPVGYILPNEHKLIPAAYEVASTQYKLDIYAAGSFVIPSGVPDVQDTTDPSNGVKVTGLR